MEVAERQITAIELRRMAKRWAEKYERIVMITWCFVMGLCIPCGILSLENCWLDRAHGPTGAVRQKR